MGRIRMFEMTREDLEDNAQLAKKVLLNAMLKSGAIDKQTYKEYEQNYAILLRHPNFFSNFWKNITKENETELDYIVVKQITMSKEEGK